MKNLTKRSEFIRLRGVGESFDKISSEIGISKPTLIKWSRDFSVEIAGAKAKALENVLDEYDLAKAGRLKILGKELSRLDVEINKRDLASIPTDKLVQMKLKALEVAGNILDAKRVEIGGNLNVTDTMSRWEKIVRECGVVINDGPHVRKIDG